MIRITTCVIMNWSVAIPDSVEVWKTTPPYLITTDVTVMPGKLAEIVM